MRKLIFSINMTLDGFCDHTAVIADEELHQNSVELLRSVDTILFGRKTYELMQSSWPEIVKTPTGIKPVDEFAVLIDNISKIVFSRTLKSISWKNAILAKEEIIVEILKLRQQPGKDILAGSPGILDTLIKYDIIDEYQLCVQPIIPGKGLQLFKNLNHRVYLRLMKTKVFKSGAVMLYYEPNKNRQ